MMKEKTKSVGYLRLSRDDGDDESSSITNQRAIIKEWAQKNNFTITKWYIDDGYSGYTMNRPDFDILKEDLNANMVDTIIVKNLSRLGRHSAKVNLFLENIEEVGKRVIALGDNYDTYDKTSHEMVGIKTWINERYVKETSKNVREAIEKMQREGRYISRVPYGYALDPFKKGHYDIDHTCAKYVQEIFDMFLNGYGVRAIAIEFNNRNVPTGSYITKQRMERRGQTPAETFNKKNIWYPRVIYSMLKNDFYIGTLTLAKTKKRTINGKQIKQSDDKLIVFEDAHEPLIDKRTFKLVQEILIERSKNNYRGKKNGDEPSTFAGKLFCATCGNRLVVRNNRVNKSYICANYNMFGTNACTSHSIHEEALNEVITFFLEHCRDNLSEAIKDFKLSMKENPKDHKDTIGILQRDLERVEKEIEILLEQKMRETLSNPNMKDIIDKTYANMVNSKYNEIKILTTQIEDMMKNSFNENDTVKELSTALDIFNDIINTKKMTRKQIETIINKIIVHEDGGLDIFLKGNLHELCTNYIQFKETKKEKIVSCIIEYAATHQDKIIGYKLLRYLRANGHRITNHNMMKIIDILVDKGYLQNNDGPYKGFRVVDLNKLIEDHKNDIVIHNTPRVQHNIVTLDLIRKICAWVTGASNVNKHLF